MRSRRTRESVDRLRLFDLAERPGEDFFGARDRDLDLVESHGRHCRRKRIDDFLIHVLVSRAKRPKSLRPN